jgi:hypothetical protein
MVIINGDGEGDGTELNKGELYTGGRERGGIERRWKINACYVLVWK